MGKGQPLTRHATDLKKWPTVQAKEVFGANLHLGGYPVLTLSNAEGQGKHEPPDPRGLHLLC